MDSEIVLTRHGLNDIQAFQYTDLLSCMLLDTYVQIRDRMLSISEAASMQLGYSNVYVLLLGVHAYKVSLDAVSGVLPHPLLSPVLSTEFWLGRICLHRRDGTARGG
jgi:hypothetical protein